MARKSERKGLGRGLSALLAETEQQVATTTAGGSGDTMRLPIEKIQPNPDQPRRDFAEEDLADLARSIAEKGVIQPLIVREDASAPGSYQIVAGERRWRAAQQAQLHELPVIIRTLDDGEVLELAIIENVQRADLNAVEEAAGYRQLMDRFGHTQAKLSQVVGKSRSHIANQLRLLSLPDAVVDLLRAGKLSAGHARALITAEDPEALAAQVVAKGLSVRQTEQLAAQAKPQVAAPKKQRLKPEKDADTRAIEAELAAQLRMKVAIDHNANGEGGAMVIHYRTLDDLDQLLQKLAQ